MRDVAQEDPPAGGAGERDGDPTWSTYTPPRVRAGQVDPAADREVGPSGGVPHVPYGPSSPTPPTVTGGGTTFDTTFGTSTSTTASGDERTGRRIILPIVALAILVPMVIGIVAAVRSYDDGTSGGGAADRAGSPVQLHTAAGFAQLVEAVEQETGSATVFDAVIYPTYAVVSAPAEASGGRSHSYYFDGALRRTGQGTTTEPRFDLGRLDAEVMTQLVARARTELVEKPTMVYLIVRRPQRSADAWWSVYASNAYTESGYLQADRTGKVVFRYVSTE